MPSHHFSAPTYAPLRPQSCAYEAVPPAYRRRSPPLSQRIQAPPLQQQKKKGKTVKAVRDDRDANVSDLDLPARLSPPAPVLPSTLRSLPFNVPSDLRLSASKARLSPLSALPKFHRKAHGNRPLPIPSIARFLEISAHAVLRARSSEPEKPASCNPDLAPFRRYLQHIAFLFATFPIVAHRSQSGSSLPATCPSLARGFAT